MGKEIGVCGNKCSNGDCIIKKMDSIEQGVYMDLKCQWQSPFMGDCPDYQPKEKKDNG